MRAGEAEPSIFGQEHDVQSLRHGWRTFERRESGLAVTISERNHGVVVAEIIKEGELEACAGWTIVSISLIFVAVRNCHQDSDIG